MKKLTILTVTLIMLTSFCGCENSLRFAPSEPIKQSAELTHELAKAEVNTIRLKLFKIGARVIWSICRIVFHLASGYPLKELFMQVVARLKQSFDPSIVFR